MVSPTRHGGHPARRGLPKKVTRAGSVEVGQHVSGALFQCSAESTQFGQSGQDAVADRLDDGGEFGLAGAMIKLGRR
ncbi:hypothetical protein SNL152K_2336 [Streptomyces sp. NL15-2K]|nr:hypothetical protein SNL152K_2336 [Streptomyces sp. NL15-2K]